MLKRLLVKNYVLIDSLDIEFPEGLVIITGQTGAGKSILLGALNLALGARADVSVIGENGGNCIVEAEFSADLGRSGLRELLEENEIDCPDGILTVRRVVNPTGRSRSFVNDSPVPVPVLQSLASHLIDIHSQHQTMMLSDRQFRLAVLDMYAGNSGLLEEYHEAYSAFVSLRNEVSALEKSLAVAREQKDYVGARLMQLESASLREGELEALEAEQKQLANAEEIKDNLCQAENLFSGVQEGDGPGMDSMLRDAERHLSRVSRFIPRVSALQERLASCRVELDDIFSEVSSINSMTDVSQDRLMQVDDRLSLLYGLMQKFSCSDEKSLIDERDRLAAIVGDTSSLEEKLAAKASELDAAEKKVHGLASALHDSRTRAASPFAAAIMSSMRFLELPSAVFEVEVLDSGLSDTGRDSVAFLFSSTGKTPSDVSKCASGGEMSRIMLSLKAMMAKFMSMPAMIFDEIDTGVSGSAADKMGSMICEMGKDMQVFAITHLPQVAAKGSAHYLVSKEADPDSSRTVSSIRRLSDGERVLELARMLSGSVLTDAAIANARVLLSGQVSYSSLTL